MAENLKAFLKGNAIIRENVKFAVSSRFVGEDNNPIEWEICPINATQDEEVRKSCTKRVPVPGKKTHISPRMTITRISVRLRQDAPSFPTSMMRNYKIHTV